MIEKEKEKFFFYLREEKNLSITFPWYKSAFVPDGLWGKYEYRKFLLVLQNTLW